MNLAPLPDPPSPAAGAAAPPDPLDAAATGDLLRAFVERRDAGAFAALVRRHGPMVLGVCRRVTGDAHDADDAFQATFLVLARKARAVRPPERLGPWLYGVAYRTAQKARATTARRRDGERRVAAMNSLAQSTGGTGPQQWDDVRPVLDEELSRLPARYRAAIVACDLEGKSRRDAAADLGVNEGTLSSRLSRGRELLAARLTRRGVALSGVALAALLTSNAAHAAAPAAALVATTASAAASLAAGGTVAAGIVSAKAAVLSEGVLHAMFVTKVKVVASLVVAAALAGTGAVVVTQYALGADKPGKVKADDQAAAPKGKADYVRPDLAGTVMSIAQDGREITIQTSKGNKTDPAATATVRIPAAADVTFSGIGPGGDAVTQGYQAQVWLAPGSKDQAARVSYTGGVSSKDVPTADFVGKITAVAADGKRLTIEPRAKPEKGAAKGEKGAAATPIDLAITPDTQVTFSAVGAGEALLQEGYDAQVTLDPKAAGTAASVRVTGTQGAAMKGATGGGAADHTGKVVAVAADGKSITLEVRGEPKKSDPADKAVGGPKVKAEVPARRVDVAIAAPTKLIYTNVPLGGANPTEGYQATVWLDGAAAKVILFTAGGKDRKGPDLSSRVESVAPDGKSITVSVPPKVKGEEPERREIDIARAKVIFNNVHAGQAKATEGYQAQVWVDPHAPGSATVVTFSPSGK